MPSLLHVIQCRIRDRSAWPEQNVTRLTRMIRSGLSLVWTTGPWSPQEETLHINCLELLVAVQTFTKGKSGILILPKLYNTTAVTYMEESIIYAITFKQGSMVIWCMKRDILLQLSSTLFRSTEFHCWHEVEGLRMETFSASPVLKSQYLAGATLNSPACK